MYNELHIQGQRNFLFSEMGKFPCLRHFRERAVQSRVSWEIRLNGQVEWILSWVDGQKKVERSREEDERTQKSRFTDFAVLPKAGPRATR